MRLGLTSLSLFVLLLSGCGAYSGSSSFPTNSTEALLRSITISGNVLQGQAVFASYSKKANRVSIIDPVNKLETWGKQVGNYQFALALPDLSGAVLFGGNSVEVDSGLAKKVFTLTQSYPHIAAALTRAAYSFSSLDGRQFEIVRSIGSGRWQHDVLSVPWGDIYPGVSEPEVGQPPLLLTSYNHDATLLAVFSPVDGRYAILTAAGVQDSLILDNNWCAGDGIGNLQDASFTSLTWDENNQVFFVGDKSGNVYALDPYAGCTTVDSLPSVNIATKPVVNISLGNNGELMAITDDDMSAGQMVFLQYQMGTISKTNSVIDNICDKPVAAMQLQTDKIIVACQENSSSSAAQQSDGLLYGSPYIYRTYSTQNMGLLLEFRLDKSDTAGVAIDVDNAILYRMLEGAFGTLQTFNLVTGQKDETQGILLNGILNE